MKSSIRVLVLAVLAVLGVLVVRWDGQFTTRGVVRVAEDSATVGSAWVRLARPEHLGGSHPYSSTDSVGEFSIDHSFVGPVVLRVGGECIAEVGDTIFVPHWSEIEVTVQELGGETPVHHGYCAATEAEDERNRRILAQVANHPRVAEWVNRWSDEGITDLATSNLSWSSRVEISGESLKVVQPVHRLQMPPHPLPHQRRFFHLSFRSFRDSTRIGFEVRDFREGVVSGLLISMDSLGEIEVEER